MAISKAEQKARTRERLLDAAAKVIKDSGFEGATVEAIAARAKTSRVTFYSHFKDKDEIAFTLTERLSGMVEEKFYELDIIDSPSKDDVLDWLKGLREIWAENKHYFEGVSASLARTDKETQIHLNRLKVHIEHCLPRQIKKRKGEERKAFVTNLILLRIQLERFFHITISRNAKIPGKIRLDYPLELLAEHWYQILFRKD